MSNELNPPAIRQMLEALETVLAGENNYSRIEVTDRLRRRVQLALAAGRAALEAAPAEPSCPHCGARSGPEGADYV